MNAPITRFTSIQCLLLTGALSCALNSFAAEPKPAFITIGTGGHHGDYYAVGRAICDQVNQGREEHGIRCSVESTSGSVYNLNTLRSGEFELGLSQSDQLADAQRGEAPFTAQGPFQTARTLFSLYQEPVTVVARKEAAIRQLADLKGKRVYIGQPGSGQSATMAALLEALDWDRDDMDEPEALTTDRSLLTLCDDEVDVMVLTVGHPHQPIATAANTCALDIVAVAGAAVDRLVTTHPDYRYAFIPGEIYAGNPEAITSFGAIATLVSTTAVDEETIYQMVKAVFERLEPFKGAHPRLEHLVHDHMIHHGLAAPLHDGAIRYYREAGLLR